eukprot:CAMPEP_0204830452 /NCGR_PEP_ID=MMETSP1346-20131115/8628_1 /ASSEMBLY_ACC=CAM_ASM_000771 /TAXON_ID=215587 /ORGANISM="Aplanochytrium stocchinoi, Strain GSBS06" /LENGTH=246 /DNA_ID=CAMNT_0051960701 /DNA_START=320 /DNA_END=1060 /DNA_ORIENTATION=-
MASGSFCADRNALGRRVSKSLGFHLLQKQHHQHIRQFSFHSYSGSGSNPFNESMHATTILSVRKGNKVVVMGDGQITQGGSLVVKPNAKKVRRLGDGGEIICGFAGVTSDAITLMERLEKRIEMYPGQVTRACVELSKLWRTDKYLRRLEALLIVVDKDVSLTLDGTGNVIESNDGIVAVGSGGSYALAAARALLDVPDYDAEMICKKSMDVAAELCVYTNNNYTTEIIEIQKSDEGDKNKSKSKK